MGADNYKEKPQIGSGTKVAESAVLLGNVRIGSNCGIWHGAVIRCEDTLISIGNNSNIQDNCVLHTDPDNNIEIGDYVTIGHSAVVHGCTIGNNCLIGMGAIVMNNAVIGDNCIIGAGALVTEGKVIPEGSVVIGSPAKIARKILDKDIRHIRENAEHYVMMAEKYL